ncbi:MAG TPA: LytTR family transcriptional regulator [Bacteroidales bacterium]|nr:LytTR family transcriptional regulator [Bacteroidales bacterium]
MFNLQSPIPAYLVDKRNIIQLILFTAAFALIFINVYAPFGVDVWFNVSRWTLLLYSSIIILTGVLVVVISRIIMFKTRQQYKLKLWQYLVWVMAEVFFMGLFYTLYQILILDDTRFFPDLLVISVQNTALVLLLPYSVLWLYFSWVENKKKLELIGSSVTTEPTKGMIHFYDERGTLRFSIKAEHLMYLEAADNYIYIHYLDSSKPVRLLLRNNLKKLDEELIHTPLVRCHRSYMVNSNRVSLIRRNKEGLMLELDLPEKINIPVSKFYVGNVMQVFVKD